MKNEKIKVRDWNAVDAHFRNSAGAMKDRREERGGARNTNRDYIDEYCGDILEDLGMDGSDDHSDCVSHGNWTRNI